MRRLHGIRHEQWDICQRCGVHWPMSQLAMQKGLLLCLPRCHDNLIVEQRSQQIEQVLGNGIDQEGADMRAIDWSWFHTGLDREEG